MKLLFLFLAAFAVARATTFSGDATIAPGYSVSDDVSVSVLATVTLSGPGNYSARSWDIA